MKKIILFAMMFITSSVVFSQQQTPNESVTIDKSLLTQDQLAKIEMDKQMKNIEMYGSWVGVGKEIGDAVKEGLTAVVDVSDKFSKTDVGKFTMILIAWQIIGQDIVKIVVGFIFLFFFTIYMFRAYRRNFIVYRVRKNGSWWKFWIDPEYEIITPDVFEGDQIVRIAYIAIFVIGYLISLNFMFA